MSIPHNIVMNMKNAMLKNVTWVLLFQLIFLPNQSSSIFMFRKWLFFDNQYQAPMFEQHMLQPIYQITHMKEKRKMQVHKFNYDIYGGLGFWSNSIDVHVLKSS